MSKVVCVFGFDKDYFNIFIKKYILGLVIEGFFMLIMGFEIVYFGFG